MNFDGRETPLRMKFLKQICDSPFSQIKCSIDLVQEIVVRQATYRRPKRMAGLTSVVTNPISRILHQSLVSLGSESCLSYLHIFFMLLASFYDDS